jgi:hypothetical protein
MPRARLKRRRVVHKSTAGISKAIPGAVDLVDNSPSRLTSNTVAQPPQSKKKLLRYFRRASTARILIASDRSPELARDNSDEMC